MSNQRNPWDRQEGEPNLWFHRFAGYKNMGPNRSLLGAYRNHLVKTSKKKRDPKTPPKSWRDRSSQWRWKERAEAWDLHQLEQWEKSLSKERKRLKKRHLEALELLLEKTVEAIPDLQPDDAGWKDLTSALRAIGMEQREAFDDLPTQRFSDVTPSPKEAVLRRLGEKFASGERASRN